MSKPLLPRWTALLTRVRDGKEKRFEVESPSLFIWERMAKSSIRKLFHNPAPGMPDPGKALYDEFQNDLVRIRFPGFERSVRELVERYRAEKRKPSEQECVELAKIVGELLSPKSCKKWLARGTLINRDEDTPLRYIAEDLERDNKLPPPFFQPLARPRQDWGKIPRPFIQRLAVFAWEEDWPLESNGLKIRLYRMAALLEYFRRGEWNWKNDRSEEDLRHVENLLNNFVRRKPYRHFFIKNLCDPDVDKDGIAVNPPNALSAKDRETLAEALALELSERRLAKFLSERNFRYSDYGNPYELWVTDKKKWHSFQTRIVYLAKQYGLVTSVV
jgi:hypothetical protein